MSSSSRVTLKQIADQLGITRMAVSLALRNKAGVSAETREKVTSLAEKLGYEPDPEVSNLLARIRASRPAETRSSIALLTAGGSHGDHGISVTERKYVEGVVSQARIYGYRVEEFRIEEKGMTAARIANILWSRGVEGIVIRPLQFELSGGRSRSFEFDFKRFSSVAISETIITPDLDRSLHDQYTAMITAMTELYRLNYQNPGLVLAEDLNLRVNGRWTGAFLQFQHHPGARKLTPPLILDGFRKQAFSKWFDRHRPDVILSVDRFGFRLAEACGLDIPGDVGYASMDLDEFLPERADISGIDQNSRMVGAAAVDMLISAIQRKRKGVPDSPTRIEVEGIWKSGKTTVRKKPVK